MKRHPLLHILSAPLAMLIMLLVSGCTHNNGDIGPLYGQWKLTEIDIDGTPSADYEGNVFWSFQSSAIEIKALYPYHEVQQCYGNWSMDGDELRLDFPDERWQLPGEVMLPASSVLHVLALNTRHALFRYNGSDGHIITYTLEKW